MLRPNLHPLPDLRAISAAHITHQRAVTFVKGSTMTGPGQYGFGPPTLVLLSPIASRVIARATLVRPLVEIPRIARRKNLPVGHFESSLPLIEINNPYALFQANLGLVRMGSAPMLESRGLRQVRPNLWVADNVRVGDIKIDPTGGPVVVGADTEIEDGVQLRGPTILGRRVTVAQRACIHHGLLLDGTYLGKEELVVHSVVSPRVRVRVATG
jgi:hypothetical protein